MTKSSTKAHKVTGVETGLDKGLESVIDVGGEADRDAAPPPLLHFEGITRQIVGQQRPLLACCTGQIHQGDRIVLMGPSGSGKSVLLRCLALLTWPDEGTIYRRSKIVTPERVYYYRSRVVYVRQNPHLMGETVREHMHFPFSLKIHQNTSYDEALVLQYLQRLGKSPSFLDKNNHDLSGGERQVVNLVATLQLQPKVLLLDEPTAALDHHSTQEVEHLIEHYVTVAQPDGAFLMVTHDPAQAKRLGNRYWTMQQGELMEDELLKDELSHD